MSSITKNILFVGDQKCICRICLTPTLDTKCWKLFDKTNWSICKELREKLTYVAGQINYKITLNPMVCQQCTKLICTTYNFKKQVEAVEGQIKKQVDKSLANPIVDLRSLLDKNAGKDFRKENFKYNDCSVNKTYNVESNKSDERWANGFDGRGKEQQELCTSRPSANRILEDYLATRERLLENCLLKIVPPNKRYRKIVQADESVNRNSRESNLEPEIIEVIIEKDLTDCDAGVVLDKSGLSNQKTVSEINLESSRDDFLDFIINDDDKGLGSEVDISLECRRKRPKKFIYTNQFSSLKSRVVKYQKRSPQGECFIRKEAEVVEEVMEDYQTDAEPKNDEEVGEESAKGADVNMVPCSELLLSSAVHDEPPKTRRKRKYPRSFDLFDEEHDRYFEQYKNAPECKLRMKWASFAKRPPQYGTGPFLCPECGVTIQSKPLYINHLAEHKGEHLVVCPYCGKLVKQQRLEYHITASHQSPKHECHCGKKFHVRQLLATHMKTMHATEDEMHQCQICGKLLRKNSIKGHVETHNLTKTYTCDICGTIFKARSYWVRHKKRHASTNGVPCSYCGKPFKCKGYLWQHVKQVHEQTDYNCETCGKRLSNRDALRRHMKGVHAPNKIDKRKKRKSPDEPKDDSGHTTSFTTNKVNVGKIEIRDEEENIFVHNKIGGGKMESPNIVGNQR